MFQMLTVGGGGDYRSKCVLSVSWALGPVLHTVNKSSYSFLTTDPCSGGFYFPILQVEATEGK